jgi:ATP-binding cassette subfamily F protein 3
VLGELERDAALEDHPRLRSHLGAFLFPGDDVQKKVSVLSGGEKARLALAKLLLRPSNVLVLDEPTNHLDVSACEVLESALVEYTGTLVVISHDRAFLNAVATRVIEVKGGALREFLGNYEDYLQRVSGAEGTSARSADRPHSKPGSSGRAASFALEERRQGKREAERARRRFAALEAEIAEREGVLEALTFRLSDPALWRDAEQARRLSADRDALRATLDGLYPEWERLAVLLEPAASE